MDDDLTTPARGRRRVVVAGAVIAVALVGGAAAFRLVDRPGSPTRVAEERSAAEEAAVATHDLTVRTVRVPGAPVAYDEGALVEVALAPATGGLETPRRVKPVDVGTPATWTDLPEGSYEVVIATRPCHGSCDLLDPPIDVCRHAVELTADTQVVAAVYGGRPCVIGGVGP